MKKIILLTLLSASALADEPIVIVHDRGNSSPPVNVIKIEPETSPTPKQVTSVTVEPQSSVVKKERIKVYANKIKAPSTQSVKSEKVDELTSVPRKDWARINNVKQEVNIVIPPKKVDFTQPKITPIVHSNKNVEVLTSQETGPSYFDLLLRYSHYILIIGVGLCVLFGVYIFMRKKEDEDFGF